MIQAKILAASGHGSFSQIWRVSRSANKRLLLAGVSVRQLCTSRFVGKFDVVTKKICHMFLVFCLSAVWLLVLTGCDAYKPSRSGAPSLQRLTVGTLALDLSSLIWVAKGRGYFAAQGLDVDIQLYESGHLALKDLVAGNLDLATASEFVSVRRGLERQNFRILSILAEAQDQELVARRDRGIVLPSDLKNKRIGIARNSSSDYYLDLLLLLEKVQPKEVTIVDILPSRQIEALTRGDVDAIMTWEPFVAMAKRELGTNVVSFPGQSGQDEYWLLLAAQKTIEKQPDAIHKFLMALRSAETFIEDYRDEAVKIVARELGDRHVKMSWANHKFLLGLHRPLVLKMEAESIWLSSASGADQPSLPDVYDTIYFDPLRSVANEKIEMLQ